MSLEDMFTHPIAFAVPATPIQRALCRIAAGVPLGDLADDAHVQAALNGGVECVGRPKETAVVAGIRTGKSLWAACLGVHAAMTCDVSGLGAGEVPRVAIASTSLDNAEAIYIHIKGRVLASPLLRTRLLSDPDASKSELLLAHPSGRPIEVCTVAGKAAGSTLVSRWMAAVVFDEYARMTPDAADGVINWTDQRKACLERILPGGYLVHVSSPTAPYGPAYDHVTKHWGTPTRDLVVVKARGDHMNPWWWTAERCAEAQARDAEVYRTDVLAEFSSPEENLFHSDLLAACMRDGEGDEPRIPGASYIATMDPATRGNGWTFGIWTRAGKKRRLAVAREWIGSSAEPVDPRIPLAEIGRLCRDYGIDHVHSDQWNGDTLGSLAIEYGVTVHTWTLQEVDSRRRYLACRTIIQLGEASLPNVPHLRADLVRVKKRATHRGIQIVLPKTSDGRHCDWAPTVMLGLTYYIDDVPAVEDEKPYVPHHDYAAEAERMKAAVLRRYGGRREEDD